MGAKAQVILYDDETVTRHVLGGAARVKRVVAPGGAEVIPFKTLDELRAPALTSSDVFSEESGQGTTEYAILVGVLVVIAIMAILLFRDKVQELWTAIADGVNSL